MENDIRLQYKKISSKLEIKLPVSKSIYNRASVISYLSSRKVKLLNYSDAEDSVKMDDLISQISDGKSFYLNCGPAGTTFRFLVSIAAITYGEWILTGSERMKERPVGILVDALRNLGAEIEYLEKEGFPPLRIKGKELEGKKIILDANISSQFISSLMMISPILKNGLEIEFSSKPVSFPYIRMTEKIMTACGANVILEKNSVKVLPKYYQSAEIVCENDWSAASYFYGFVAVNPDLRFYLPGLQKESLQGDAIVREIFSNLGIVTEFTENGIEIYNNNTVSVDFFEYDFSDCPDLAQTLAFTCCALRIPGKLTGLSTLKNKETDRIEALKTELEKCGMKCEITSDSISFSVTNSLPEKIFFHTYDDHRMAMSEAIMSLSANEITIENRKTVQKSFPGFWEECGKFLSIS